MSLESEINKHIIHKLEQERDMYKRNWDKTLKERDCLNDKLNQAYEDGYQMEGKYRDMKTQRDTLIDDIAVLRGNNERLERENKKYIKLLKEFNQLIKYKLVIHPGSDIYMYYRSELNKLGVK